MVDQSVAGQVTLSIKEYDELLKSDIMLRVLINYGVDQWNRYEAVLEELHSKGIL